MHHLTEGVRRLVRLRVAEALLGTLHAQLATYTPRSVLGHERA